MNPNLPTDDTLAAYPDAIETCEQAVYDAHLAYRQAQQDVADLETDYKAEASYDASLTNETKRKAHVETRKQEDPAYGDAALALAEAERDLRHAETQAQRVRAEFTVAKLQYERGTALVAAGLPGLVYDLTQIPR